METSEKNDRVLRKPDWIRKKLFFDSQEDPVKKILHNSSVRTVCQEARCPNLGECFSNHTATFLLLGNVCTRNCRFCNISGQQGQMFFDRDEPARVVEAVLKLALKYVVLTSVTRDDLVDGGAEVFAQTVKLIRQADPRIEVEVLVPDFGGNRKALEMVVKSDISVFNHNLETVPALYERIRPEADYNLSLDLLQDAKIMRHDLVIKTGIMVGFGETEEQVISLMADIAAHGVDILTIGQYLPPGKDYFPVFEYVTPEQFAVYEKKGCEAGITEIVAGPLVRSSYLAEKTWFRLNSD